MANDVSSDEVVAPTTLNIMDIIMEHMSSSIKSQIIFMQSFMYIVHFHHVTVASTVRGNFIIQLSSSQ